jgi:exodeoxyribonuclease-3
VTLGVRLRARVRGAREWVKPAWDAAMLKVLTWNVNGIRARSAEVRALLERERPDVVCLQEVKASPEHVPVELLELPTHFGCWHGHKGYSGVALLFARESFGAAPAFVHPAFDVETRIVTAEASGVSFASIYVPNGGKDFGTKVRFLTALDGLCREAQAEGRKLIVCGDLNVAREERDVHPTLRNPLQIGQTAGERELLERIIGRGLVDLSRKFHADDDELFTWWAPWRKHRERNIGWRLDYVLASAALAERAIACEARREEGTSDHGPVIATFDLAIERKAAPDDGRGPAVVESSGQLRLI